MGTTGRAAPVDNVVAGDDGAFAAAAQRHRRELLVHCYRMTGSLEDAEDLVQETLIRAFRSHRRVISFRSFRRLNGGTTTEGRNHG